MLAGLRLSAREKGFGRWLSAFPVRHWGGRRGARRPQTWQLVPVTSPQISVLLENGWMFSGIRLIRGDSQTPTGKRGHRRNRLPSSEPGPGSLPCPSGAKPECQLGDEAPSRNVVVNYAINPTSNNIKLVFTPITPTGKLFSDLSALEAKIFPLISSLN